MLNKRPSVFFRLMLNLTLGRKNTSDKQTGRCVRGLIKPGERGGKEGGKEGDEDERRGGRKKNIKGCGEDEVQEDEAPASSMFVSPLI